MVREPGREPVRADCFDPDELAGAAPPTTARRAVLNGKVPWRRNAR